MCQCFGCCADSAVLICSSEGAEIIFPNPIVDHYRAHPLEGDGASPKGLAHVKVMHDVCGAEIPTKNLQRPEDGVVEYLVLFDDYAALNAHIVTV